MTKLFPVRKNSYFSRIINSQVMFDLFMKRIVYFLVMIMTSLQPSMSFTQETVNDKMQWFRDAKLGIFIHWGIYSVDGVDESWSFYNHKLPYEKYMEQLKGFTARNYKPVDWVKLIKETGARYTVLTTKHHDGVALWDTKANDLSVVKLTPSGRDVLTPFTKEVRKAGLKLGLYFSILDWSHPDYPGFLKDSNRYAIKDDSVRWNRYLRFYQKQIKELSNDYNPDLFWFDGDWEHSADEWQADKVRANILEHNPRTIINSRLTGRGDYDTPEQNFPVTRPERVWELCMTCNNNWGYHPDDTNYKTPYEVITIFADAISNGGNLLLDIGPREDGWIPDEQVHILKELGKWNKKHAEAIFGTVAGLPQGHYYGASTLSKDSTTIYLFVPAKDAGKICIKGLVNPIKDIRIIGSDIHPGHKIVGKISWSHVPGLVFIDNLPETALDEYMTVVEIKLDGKLKLYRGTGGFQ